MGFAGKIERSEPAVRTWCRDYNFPFPLVSPGELVCLMDDTPPHELRWVSDDWCEYVGRDAHELLNKTAAQLRELGFASGSRDKQMTVTRYLRANLDVKEGTMPGWILRADQVQVPVDFGIRYSKYAGLFYLRAMLALGHANGHAPVETFEVDPNVVDRRREAEAIGHDVLSIIEMDHDGLLEYLNRNLPPYRLPAEQ